MNFYISDTHFGHENVIGFDKRPFTSVEEMEYTMTELWNARVRTEDDVYILGDMVFKRDKSPYELIRRLNGRKHLVIGNHDVNNIMKNRKTMELFVSAEQMMTIKDGDKRIVLCHYPILEWDGCYGETIHIYGHIHNRKERAWKIMSSLENCYNAGCMINNYMPVTLNELIKNNRLFNEKAVEESD